MKTVIELARESKVVPVLLVPHGEYFKFLERFAELVRADERARMAEQPAQQEQEPMISTEHGPWIPSTHPGEEGESYCKRCLLRDKFLGSRQCDPHIVLPEQPAQHQEPVAYGVLDEDGQIDWTCEYPFTDDPGWPDSVPLYTSPPAQRTWVGLTDEEVTKMPSWIYSPDQDGMTAQEGLETFARAIEAKLKEKNT